MEQTAGSPVRPVSSVPRPEAPVFSFRFVMTVEDLYAFNRVAMPGRKIYQGTAIVFFAFSFLALVSCICNSINYEYFDDSSLISCILFLIPAFLFQLLLSPPYLKNRIRNQLKVRDNSSYEILISFYLADLCEQDAISYSRRVYGGFQQLILTNENIIFLIRSAQAEIVPVRGIPPEQYEPFLAFLYDRMARSGVPVVDKRK